MPFLDLVNPASFLSGPRPADLPEINDGLTPEAAKRLFLELRDIDDRLSRSVVDLQAISGAVDDIGNELCRSRSLLDEAFARLGTSETNA